MLLGRLNKFLLVINLAGNVFVQNFVNIWEPEETATSKYSEGVAHYSSRNITK